MDDENKTHAKSLEKSKESDTTTDMGKTSHSACGSNSENRNSPSHVSLEEGISTDLVNKVSDTLESINLAGGVSGSKGQLTLLILLTCLKFSRSLLRIRIYLYTYLHNE